MFYLSVVLVPGSMFLLVHYHCHPLSVCKTEISIFFSIFIYVPQGSHRLDKYLNLGGFLEKSLKIISALKSTGK